jgi:hypothetical protein
VVGGTTFSVLAQVEEGQLILGDECFEGSVIYLTKAKSLPLK